MGFTEAFIPGDNAQRVQRSILLFIILATLPCYCVGAILLGVAPSEDPEVVETTQTQPFAQTQIITVSPTLVSPTAIIIGSPTSALQSTPGQFIPPSNTPVILPSATNAPTQTLSPTPTSTATATLTQTATQQANNMPTFNTLPTNINVQAGGVQGGSFTASDPDGDPLTFTASSSNTGVATVAVVNNFNFNVTGVSGGSATITLILDDGRGGVVQTSITATVNGQPVFNTQPANTSVATGASTSVNLDYSDPDGDLVTAAASSDNSGIASVVVSSNSVQITGGTPGVAVITVTLDDGRGGSAVTTFNVTVTGATNQKPVFNTEPTAIIVNLGDTITVFLNVSDPDGDPLTVTAVSGDGTILSTSNATASSFDVSGLLEGNTTVTITLNDGKTGGTAQRVVNASVIVP